MAEAIVRQRRSGFPDGPRCGSPRRHGRPPCELPAGWRTDHPGDGRCHLHGGRQQKFPIKHEKIRDLVKRFAEDPDPTNLLDEVALLRALAVHFINEHEERTEALLAWHASFQLTRRPLPEDLVIAFERVVDEWENALRERVEPTPAQEANLQQARKFLGILRNGTDDAKPRKVSDIADAANIVDKIGVMVERIEKMRGANAMSEQEVNRLFNGMGRVVDAVIPNGELPASITGDQLKERIREGWLDLVTR